MMRTCLIILLVVLTGCASIPTSRTQPGFDALAFDPRVLHEPGADQQAAQVAQCLPQAIAQVENTHYRTFSQPIVVHVCGTESCFSEHVASKNVSGATVPNNQVFLSPRLFDHEAHRLPMILAHELSHLHLGQQIGHYTHQVPVWFHEGLAAFASNGGGADYASEEEALAAMRRGHAFQPTTLDNANTRHKAEHWQLSPYVFYRQSMMFLQHLKQTSEENFRNFLTRVQDQEDFTQAFSNAYNMSLDEAGQRFLQSFMLDAAAPAAP